jgi:hypothetical protein
MSGVRVLVAASSYTSSKSAELTRKITGEDEVKPFLLVVDCGLENIALQIMVPGGRLELPQPFLARGF